MATRAASPGDIGEFLSPCVGLIDADHLDRRTALAAIGITAFFWTANFVIQSLRAWLDDWPDLWDYALARLVTTAIGIALCYAIHLVVHAMRRKPFWQRAVALVLVVPVAADACSWANFLTSRRFAPSAVMAVPTSGATVQAIVYWTWFLLAWGALYLALRYSMEMQAAERRARQVQGLAHAAQMRALHNQINPHFMFNTLNSIAALILDGDRVASEAMVTRLADFLRATLAIDPLVDVKLADELAVQQLYLDIEQVRFPDMQAAIDSQPQVRDWLVPPMILQPLVENAVKHGVATRSGRHAITIAARALGDRLELSVSNDRGATNGRGGLGLGLENVRARLAGHYGAANFSFDAGAEGDAYRVVLTLPRQEG